MVGHARVLGDPVELYRPGLFGCAGSGSADKGWRANVFRPGGICRLGRLHNRVPDNGGRLVALAGAHCRPAADAGRCLYSGGHYAAPVGSLSAFGHDRLGPVALLLVRKHGVFGPVRRYCRYSACECIWFLVGQRA